MLATPAAFSRSAKLRSAWVDSSGTPSSRSCEPEAPSSSPPGPAALYGFLSSFQLTSN